MRIILGDSLEELRKLESNSIDAIVTDPPYGITKAKWDKVPSKEYFDEIQRVAKKIAVFGGHFFPHLPRKDGWVIWNKMPFLKTTNECELIWTNFLKKNKIIDFIYAGNCVGSRKPNYNREKVYFTSEKPVEFLEVFIQTFLPDASTIMDPFMGTGAVGVACQKLGKKFIGIEREREHAYLARQRLKLDT